MSALPRKPPSEKKRVKPAHDGASTSLFGIHTEGVHGNVHDAVAEADEHAADQQRDEILRQRSRNQPRDNDEPAENRRQPRRHAIADPPAHLHAQDGGQARGDEHKANATRIRVRSVAQPGQRTAPTAHHETVGEEDDEHRPSQRASLIERECRCGGRRHRHSLPHVRRPLPFAAVALGVRRGAGCVSRRRRCQSLLRPVSALRTVLAPWRCRCRLAG